MCPLDTTGCPASMGGARTRTAPPPRGWTAAMRRRPRRALRCSALRTRVPLIVLVCLLLAAAVPAHAAQQVSYPTLLQQIKSGPLIRAVINRKRSAIEIKFRDLSEWEAFYPPGAQPMLQRLLHERHIRVIFASRHHATHAKPRAVHHHLRYIAAGILG